MTDKEYREYLQSWDWKQKAQQRLKIDHYRCTMCNCAGTSSNRLEVHHLTYRNLRREDVFTDLLTLCSSCHKSVHRMMERKTSPDGRMGWKSEKYVPQVHTFTLSGDDIGSIAETEIS